MKPLREDALRELVAMRALHNVVVRRTEDGGKWLVAVRGHGLTYRPLRSDRRDLRTWASLETLAGCLKALGVEGFRVEQ